MPKLSQSIRIMTVNHEAYWEIRRESQGLKNRNQIKYQKDIMAREVSSYHQKNPRDGKTLVQLGSIHSPGRDSAYRSRYQGIRIG